MTKLTVYNALRVSVCAQCPFERFTDDELHPTQVCGLVEHNPEYFKATKEAGLFDRTRRVRAYCPLKEREVVVRYDEG